MPSLQRIALFGGTFDPVHAGHVAMAQQAVSRLALDRVIFLPCRISPHKQDTLPSSAEDRLAMLKLATAEFDWALVDDTEIRRDEPSYSWKTAEKIQQRFADARLYWIMGSDQWDVIETWDRPQHLATLVEFIVFCRNSTPDQRTGYRLHALEDVHPANATTIRKEFSQAGQASADLQTHPWLNEKVAAYIADKGLFATTS